jgi:hypothetical protein
MVHPALCWIAAGGVLSFSTIFWIESRRVPHPSLGRDPQRLGVPSERFLLAGASLCQKKDWAMMLPPRTSR